MGRQRREDAETPHWQVWLLNVVCISFYASVFVFLQNGTQFLQQARLSQTAAPLSSGPIAAAAISRS